MLAFHERFAELAAEVKESKNFANQTWQSHVNSLTDDPVMRDVMHLLRDSEEITTAMMLGKVQAAVNSL